jgi:hypothetical protein
MLSLSNQDLAEILKDVPISAFIGICQSRTRDGTLKADVVKLHMIFTAKFEGPAEKLSQENSSRNSLLYE